MPDDIYNKCLAWPRRTHIIFQMLVACKPANHQAILIYLISLAQTGTKLNRSIRLIFSLRNIQVIALGGLKIEQSQTSQDYMLIILPRMCFYCIFSPRSIVIILIVYACMVKMYNKFFTRLSLYLRTIK